jgi:chromosome partitioning protein
MGKIICIANQKGGVGKTTTAINVAAGLGFLGQKVILVDCDAQGNSTSGTGISGECEPNLYHVMTGVASVGEAVVKDIFKGLDVLPSNMDLVGIETELATVRNREHVLSNVVSALDGYDFVLLDCPPSLGLMTLNALVAAHSVLIPLQCEYYALEGLGQLVHTIRLVRHNFNPKLYIEGLLLTMYDSRTRLTFQVAKDVRAHFKDSVYRAVIPRNVRLSESPSHGKPILYYDKRSKGAESYLALCKEILKRQEKNR